MILIGIVASDLRLALRSLRDYVKALDLEFVQPEIRVPGVETLSAVKGPVYVKYNAGSRSSYVSGYSGGDRGVLLSMGQIQIGHLPLGLFDEAKASPAVEI